MNGDRGSTISRDLLFGLVNVLVPDGPGQVLRPTSPGSEVWLNPQPLPPRTGLLHDPWRAVAVARTVVSMAALALSSAEDDDGDRAGRATLKSFVDELCGDDHAVRVPLPPPWPRADVRPNPLDLVIVAGQLHASAVALAGHPLCDEFELAADRLMKTALQRLTR